MFLIHEYFYCKGLNMSLKIRTHEQRASPDLRSALEFSETLQMKADVIRTSGWKRIRDNQTAHVHHVHFRMTYRWIYLDCLFFESNKWLRQHHFCCVSVCWRWFCVLRQLLLMCYNLSSNLLSLCGTQHMVIVFISIAGWNWTPFLWNFTCSHLLDQCSVQFPPAHY